VQNSEGGGHGILYTLVRLRKHVASCAKLHRTLFSLIPVALRLITVITAYQYHGIARAFNAFAEVANPAPPVNKV